jgi:hypothetical protein
MLREMGGYAEGDEWLSLRDIGGSLGSNPDTSPKNGNMGDISKGLANTP